MDFGHGITCVCTECCKREVGNLSQGIGFMLLGAATVMFVVVLAKDKFDIKKTMKRFF